MLQLLEDMLSEQKNLKNKGHSTEEIQCAALMAQGSVLSEIHHELSNISEHLSNIEVNIRGTD